MIILSVISVALLIACVISWVGLHITREDLENERCKSQGAESRAFAAILDASKSKNVCRRLILFQLRYSENTKDKMPGNELYSEDLMDIVKDARIALGMERRSTQ